MTMQDVYVEELVDSAVLTLKKQGEAKGVKLTKDIQPDLLFSTGIYFQGP